MKHQFIGQQDWPVDVVMPAAEQQMAELSVGILVAVFVLWGLRNLLKNGDARLLICMVAGFAACVMETHTMYMLKFFYPQVGQHVFLSGFGRPIPVFLALMYSAFFGIASYFYINSKMATQFSAQRFVVGMGALFIAELLLEVVCVNAGVWAYFGDQPFLILDFPPHVAVIVGCISVVLGAVSRIWFDRVKGPGQYWLLLLGPVILFAAFEVFSFPIAFALWSGGGLFASQIGGVLSIVLPLGLTYVCARELGKVPNITRPVSTAHSAAGVKSADAVGARS